MLGKQKLQRNKYLDNLGLDIKYYGINWSINDGVSKGRRIKFAKQKMDYGFDEREVWNLDTIFFQWLYSHIKMYLDTTNVNLEWHKIEYEGVEYTLEGLIQKEVDLLEIALKMDDIDAEMAEEICKIWGKIVLYMWW